MNVSGSNEEMNGMTPCFQHDSYRPDCGDCRDMNGDEDVAQLKAELEQFKAKIAAALAKDRLSALPGSEK